MNSPVISIIVPVYNAEKTLHRCIESFIHQTYREFELLLIDDGSTDKSKDICETYLKIDSRIRYYRKANSGVASTRQYGMNMAMGEYIIHADSDDWVECHHLFNLIGMAQTTQADLVYSDYFYNDNSVQLYIDQHIDVNSSDYLFRCFFTKGIHASLWNKLIRRSIIDSCKATFFDGLNYCEDLLFWAQILPGRALKISYIHQASYHYDCCSNTNSITRKYTLQTYRLRCDCLAKLKTILSKNYSSEIGITELIISKEAYLNGAISLAEFVRAVRRNINFVLQMPIGKKNKIALCLLYVGLTSLPLKLLS